MTELTGAIVTEMIRATASRLDGAASELSRLDAVAGDGDHGVNMASAFRDAESALKRASLETAGDAFAAVGNSFSERAGGSAGALFGGIFAAIGGRLRASPDPGPNDLVEGLELATKRVALIGQTKTGSKTLLDALAPAVEAARSAVDAGGGLVDLMAAAATAAEKGAAETTHMRAAAGRARHATDGAVGTPDPGAVTVSIMFAAWADAVSQGFAP